MKKMIPFTLLGVAIEIVFIWLLHKIGYLNFQNVNWHDKFIWIFFFLGVFSAYWLIMWFKLINKFLFKKEKKQSPSPASHPVAPVTSAHAIQPPARMSVQNNAVLTVSPQGAAPVSSTNVAAAASPAPVASATPAAAPQQLSQKQQDINMLSTIDSHLDMMAFKHVALDGKMIDLVYSSDDTAILCKVFSDEHAWTVDISHDIENSVWTDETGATQSPCLDLLTQAAILENMENGAQIVPTILLVRGSVNNAADVEKYLLQNHINLVKYNAVATDGIRDLHSLLEEKFNLFKEDDEEETKEESTSQPS